MSNVQRQWLELWAALESSTPAEILEEYGLPTDTECADMLGVDAELGIELPVRQGDHRNHTSSYWGSYWAPRVSQAKRSPGRTSIREPWSSW